MSFDLTKFLLENKLTNRGKLNEDLDLDNTPDEEYADSDGDYEDDSEDEDYSDDSENEPTAKDVKSAEVPTDDLGQTNQELSTLEAKKDKLIMQLRANVIDLDQYKHLINGIPERIKILRSKLSQGMTLDSEDEDDLEG